MQLDRAAHTRARVWPWTLAFVLGSMACGQGIIDGAQGVRRGDPGSTGGGTSGGSTTTGGSTTGGGPNLCNPGSPKLNTTRAWRLTRPQIKNTFLDAFSFGGTVVDNLPDDSRLEGYANHPDGLGISSLLADYYFRAADEIATHVTTTSA